MGQHFNENIYEIEIEIFWYYAHLQNKERTSEKKNEQKTGLTE